ncbi:MAG TPA: MoaD/ThiS family protein [Planctomycetota bacterium]|jgi:molybdopterin converting factor small subunit|nr:MoaD/ThiS family protein [Planctomycetota bacterium]
MVRKARVTVRFPGLVAQATGVSRVEVEAATLREAIDAALAASPALRHHLFEPDGRFRLHVLCLHNGTDARRLPSLDVPVADGDVVTFAQAVSGG